MKVLVNQSCLTICKPMDYSQPGSSVHGILQARILEWVAISYSSESSQPRDGTWVSCTVSRFFTICYSGSLLSTLKYIYFFFFKEEGKTCLSSHLQQGLLCGFYIFSPGSPLLLCLSLLQVLIYHKMFLCCLLTEASSSLLYW